MSAEFFLDNWAYLKVEFNWLERLLLNAVARQRKDLKAIDQVSQRTADRVTSHWWKGLMSFDAAIAADSPVEQRKAASGMTYQQQVDARIRRSQDRGIGLALPMLCDRLNLTTAEKNVILIALAPEVQRRYAQLYGYLQSGHEIPERPTVDLVLKLLCRTDAEWRTVRSLLLDSSRLVQSGVIEVGQDRQGSRLLKALHPQGETFLSPPRSFHPKDESFSFLGRSLHLKDEFVEFLLKDPVELDELEELVSPAVAFEPAFVRSIPRSPIELVAPESVQEQLAQVCDQVRFAPQLRAWGFGGSTGTTALLIGASGTGKTTAVQSIAQQLELPLTEIDLSIVDDPSELIDDLIAEPP
ncbi:MAG TPA: AAA family ATPase, partial [Leptolyngbya sp.]|nr:AAA family ATPase [Leptolyngbya sp.]